MRKAKKSVAAVLATAAVAVGLIVAPALPASATDERQCTNSAFVWLIGYTTTTSSVTGEDGDCGTVYNRTRYAHVGGTTWTSWRSGAQTAGWSGMSNVDRGEHRATYKSVYTTYP